MADKIAEYFGQLKFVVDDKGLKSFVKQLDDVAKKMQSLTKNVGGGGSASRKVAVGLQQIGEEAKRAASAVEQATAKIGRSQQRLANKSGSLIGTKAADLTSTGAFGRFQNRAQLLAFRDRFERLNSAREARDAIRARRRAETATKEDERRYQNRVSRTYAPRESRLAQYQSDLARTQAAYNSALAAGDVGAKRYAEAIKKLKREIVDLNREKRVFRMGGFGMGGVGSFFVPMVGMSAAGGMAGLGYSAVALNDQLVQQQSISAQFQGLYGNEAAGQAGYQKFKDYANLRGVRQQQVAQDYLGFMYSAKTNIGLEGANKIFENFTDFAKVRGTTGERYKRALAALSQMTSKNRIYSEELTQQLSEHLFGSKEVFAEVITGKKGGDAMTQLLKMMKSDEGVVTADWLPKVSEEMARLAKETGVLDKMSNNLDGSLARMNNEWKDFIETLEKAGVADAMARFIQMLTDKLSTLEGFVKDNGDAFVTLIDNITKFGDTIMSKDAALVALIAGLTALLVWVKGNVFWWGILNTTINATAIWTAVKAMWAMAAAAAAAVWPITLVVAVVSALVLLFEDLYQWSQGNDSVFGRLFGDTDTVFKNLDDGFKKVREWWDISVTYLKTKWTEFTDFVSKPFSIGEGMLDGVKRILGIQPTIADTKPLVTGAASPYITMNNVTIRADDPRTLVKRLDESKYVLGAR